jgi:nucleotide-binding universal stress UspA family protein
MAEKVLIPLDCSRFGETALHYMEDMVEKLEPKEKPEITLMTVISPHVEHLSVEGGYVDINDPTEDLGGKRIKALDYLNKSGNNLKNKGAIVHNKVVINDNHLDTSENIISIEEEIHPDLVAMSAHHRSVLFKWIHHNTADKVSRKGKVPVILVRDYS